MCENNFSLFPRMCGGGKRPQNQKLNWTQQEIQKAVGRRVVPTAIAVPGNPWQLCQADLSLSEGGEDCFDSVLGLYQRVVLLRALQGDGELCLKVTRVIRKVGTVSTTPRDEESSLLS